MINNMIIINSLLFLSISLVLYFKKSIILKLRNVERYLGFFNFLAAVLIIRGIDSSRDNTILLIICFFNILLLHDFRVLMNSLIPNKFKLLKEKYFISKYIVYNGHYHYHYNDLVDIKQLYFSKLLISFPKDSEYSVEKNSLEKYFIHSDIILPSLYMFFSLIQLFLIIL